MQTKKAKQWDQWHDVRTTYRVQTPRQVKLSILWYWIRQLVKSQLPDQLQHLQHHENDWRIAEEKENKAVQFTKGLGFKGQDIP